MQYLRDTRAELSHVSWPTNVQTFVYTALVASISIFLSAYLGLFDYAFTNSLSHVVDIASQYHNTAADLASSTSSTSTRASSTAPAITVTPVTPAAPTLSTTTFK